MNIIVTGVSKGLGLAITECILKRGWTVYGISRSRSEHLSALLENFPQSFHWISYDLSNSADIKTTIFRDWIGFKTPVNGFVNNAAIAYDDIVTNLDTTFLENMFKVNVYTPMILSKYIIRQMLLHNIKGSIVHLSSISVHTGYKGLAMYASTKGAIEAYSKNMAREWGVRGIRSNCVVAGFMETDMSSSLSSENKKKIYQRTSLKKATSTKSVAETIAFLLSDASDSITGQNINVDSGTI